MNLRRRLRQLPIALALALSLSNGALAAGGGRHGAATAKSAELGSPLLLGKVEQAVHAYQSGDYATTEKLLTPLSAAPAPKGLPALRSRDYVYFLLAESQALLASEHEGEAARKLLTAAVANFRIAEKVPSTTLGTRARARIADCLLKLGGKKDLEDAESLYRAALAADKSGSSVDGAVLRSRLAELLEKSSRANDARPLLRQIYIEHPLHPLAEPSLARLHVLDAEAKLEISERLSRAKNLLSGRRWALAMAEFAAMPTDLAPALRDEVDYWHGTSMYRLRHAYVQASEKLLAVAPRLKGERQVEAMFHGARALSRADRDDDAIQRYRELVKAHPRSTYSAEASFLAGWLDWNRGRYPQAIASLLETLKSYSGNFAEEAHWYIAFSRYLLGDFAGAMPELEHVAKRPGLNGQKGQYWGAVVQLRLGHKDEAIKRFTRLVESAPLTYYAQLSRVRLKDLSAPLGPFGETEQKPDGVPYWPLPPDKAAPVDKAGKGAATRAPQDPTELAMLRDADYLRPLELIQIGLRAEAALELRRVESELLKRHGAEHALPVVMQTYVRAGAFQRPHLLAESHGGAAQRRDPHKIAAARPWWEHRFPLAYKDLIEKYAPTGKSPPRYLYAIMQKESAYNPHDVSYADAIGLLQMIPPTSRKVAREIGRSYGEDTLYDPEGNIQLGAWYIGRLLQKFKGQVALGAGSFNAGPVAMMRWLGRNGSRPLDEFVELCPYTQTREYMKKLLDIYAHYVYLWDKEDYLPSLTVDKDYLAKDGIDY